MTAVNRPTRFAVVISRIVCVVAALAACSSNSDKKMTFAKFPPVAIKPSDLPTYAVGDSFTFDNPAETWIVSNIQDELVEWKSSRGATKTTAFDPFLPPLLWSGANGEAGTERLIKWRKSLFPLTGRKKITFQSARLLNGQAKAKPYIWRCFSGNPRKVTVKAGVFPAFPVFCRRSDDLTVQYFYAPDVNAPLLITTRKRPAAEKTRELIGVKLADGARIAANVRPGLPRGWVQGGRTSVASVAKKETAANDIDVVHEPKQIVAKPVVTSRNHGKAEPTKTNAFPAAPATGARKPKQQTAKNRRQETPGPRVAIAPPPIPKIMPPVMPPRATARPAPSTRKRPIALATRPPKADANARSHAKPNASKSKSGSFGVQIASFRNAESLGPAWIDFERRFRPLLTDIGGMVQKAEFGDAKGVFHRLIAGPFETRGGAEVFCRTIRKRSVNCFVLAIPN